MSDKKHYVNYRSLHGIPVSLSLYPGAGVASLARLCATRHVQWLIVKIENHGMTVTPERVATAWNRGLGYLYRHVPEQTDYGIELANLYYDLATKAAE